MLAEGRQTPPAEGRGGLSYSGGASTYGVSVSNAHQTSDHTGARHKVATFINTGGARFHENIWIISQILEHSGAFWSILVHPDGFDMAQGVVCVVG